MYQTVRNFGIWISENRTFEKSKLGISEVWKTEKLNFVNCKCEMEIGKLKNWKVEKDETFKHWKVENGTLEFLKIGYLAI